MTGPGSPENPGSAPFGAQHALKSLGETFKKSAPIELSPYENRG